jgi:hypothetical protein
MTTLPKLRYILLLGVCLFTATVALAQEDDKKVMDIYGFIMLDAGYNANVIDPAWFDVVRPTKLPESQAQANAFGTEGNFYASVRQTRFGVKNYFDTPKGKLFTQFEFEMFGTGADAGQTTIRLRHAYAELGAFGVGQYWSPFMDIDVFPNTVEYWGPNGMVFFRNVQARWMPIRGATRLTIALERPGASADQGNYSGNLALANVRPRFMLPDLSAEYRKAFDFGYVELSGIARSIAWKDLGTDAEDLSGSTLGWGLHLSTNIKFLSNKVTFRGSAVYGQGIQNYMNDATVDVGVKENFSDPTRPFLGVALPMYGLVGFFDINWSEKMSSAIGYSVLDITNSNGQAASAFHKGSYAAANLMFYPVKNSMLGVELQYGDRTNFSDGWKTNILKVQFTAKYNFSQSFYKQ